MRERDLPGSWRLRTTEHCHNRGGVVRCPERTRLPVFAPWQQPRKASREHRLPAARGPTIQQAVASAGGRFPERAVRGADLGRRADRDRMRFACPSSPSPVVMSYPSPRCPPGARLAAVAACFAQGPLPLQRCGAAPKARQLRALGLEQVRAPPRGRCARGHKTHCGFVTEKRRWRRARLAPRRRPRSAHHSIADAACSRVALAPPRRRSGLRARSAHSPCVSSHSGPAAARRRTG